MAKVESVDHIKKRINMVRREAGKRHNEEAHILEDEILLETLRAIAEGAPNPKELAQAAIKVADIDYFRWYA